jgi:hypothetical protein
MQITISKKAVFIVIALILVVGIAFMASRIFTQSNVQNDLSNSGAPVTNTTVAAGQSASDPYASTTAATSPDSNSYMGIQGGNGATTSDSSYNGTGATGSNYSGTATSGTDNTGGTYSDTTGNLGTTTGVGTAGGDGDGDNDND